MDKKKKYLLGELLFDPDSRLLTSNGNRVHLAKLPFQVLLYLIENRDRVVTRDELLDKFWDGKDVYSDTLRKCVGTIRVALKDGGEQTQYIETIHGQGYRYIGPLRELFNEADSAESSLEKFPDVRLVIEGESRDVLEIQLSPSREQTVKLLQPVHSKLTQPRAMALALTAVCVLAVPLFMVFRKDSLSSTVSLPRSEMRSIAVLPLKNLSNDAGQEYFSDGVTESLITELTRIRDLKVIARNSSFAFKGKEVDVREIGQRLGVDSVLEGSLRRDAETVRVTVRLINAADGRVLWTGDTMRPVKDIIAVQDEIGCSVAENLKTVLCKDPNRKTSTNNLVAYDAYLKGREQRFKYDLKKSEEFFRLAVKTDPDYALAWAGLAETYTVMEVNSAVPPRSMTAKAKECALKAIALDSSLSSPYAALGLLTAFSDRDWAGGERYLQQAISINPNYAIAHSWYGNTLMAQGKFAEAETEYLRARDLDPLNPGFLNNLAETYHYWRQPDRCLAQAAKALELDPANEWARFNQAKCYASLGRYDEALQVPLPAIYKNLTQATIFAISNRQVESRRLLPLVVKDWGQTSPYVVAIVHTLLRDKETAFTWLYKAADRQQADLVSLKIEPSFDSLRADPRFAELLRRVGLTP
ncbi:MAG: winged helix-turn-helix domain-containing tetratricopeptide repeat protein [Blastocatellales bacterium]